jgi:hypothetical protein
MEKYNKRKPGEQGKNPKSDIKKQHKIQLRKLKYWSEISR